MKTTITCLRYLPPVRQAQYMKLCKIVLSMLLCSSLSLAQQPQFGGVLEPRPPATKSEKALQEKETEQFTKYALATDLYPLPLLKVLHNYDLTDELSLSESQIRNLLLLDLSSPAAISNRLRDGKEFPLKDADFNAFMSNFRRDYSATCRRSDAEVESVLNDEQVVRLRQIRFQFHAVLHPKAKPALGSQNLSLAARDKARCEKDFSGLVKVGVRSRAFVTAAIVMEILTDIIDRSKIHKAAGVSFYANKRQANIAKRIDAIIERPSSYLPPRRN